MKRLVLLIILLQFMLTGTLLADKHTRVTSKSRFALVDSVKADSTGDGMANYRGHFEFADTLDIRGIMRMTNITSSDTNIVYWNPADSTLYTLSLNPTSLTTLTNGNTGELAISDGTSGLQYDGNLFWDTANGFLGIGLATPSARLSIKGTGEACDTKALQVTNVNDDQVFNVCDNGALKIGLSVTDDPIKTLDVAGNFNFDTVQSPTAAEWNASAVLNEVPSSGTLLAGTYIYDVAFITEDGDASAGAETSGSTLQSITISANSAVSITGIPISPDPRVTGRKIYRTSAGGSWAAAYRIYTINDNTTTSFIDTGYSQDTSDLNYRKPNKTAGILNVDGSVIFQALNFNTAGGLEALTNNTSGNSNTAYGRSAARGNTTGSNNSVYGYNAGYLIGVSSDNSLFGYGVAQQMTGGNSNSIFGMNGLNSGAFLVGNSGLGYGVLGGLSSYDYYNSGFGYRAGYGFGGDYNLLLGAETGRLSTPAQIGSYNIFAGYDVGDNAIAGANNNILIGKQLDLQTAAGSNQLSIGNAIFGIGIDGTGTAISNGAIGIMSLPVTGITLTVGGALTWTGKGSLSEANAGVGSGIDLSGNYNVQVDSTDFEFNAKDQIAIKAQGIDAADLALGSVTLSVLADSSVNIAKIKGNSISSSKIIDGTITQNDLSFTVDTSTSNEIQTITNGNGITISPSGINYTISNTYASTSGLAYAHYANYYRSGRGEGLYARNRAETNYIGLIKGAGTYYATDAILIGDYGSALPVFFKGLLAQYTTDLTHYNFYLNTSGEITTGSWKATRIDTTYLADEVITESETIAKSQLPSGTMLVARATVTYTSPNVSVALMTTDGDYYVHDIKMNVTQAFNDTGVDVADVGRTGSQNYFANDLDLTTTGWQDMNLKNQYSVNGSVDITFYYAAGNEDATQGSAVLYITYCKF